MKTKILNLLIILFVIFSFQFNIFYSQNVQQEWARTYDSLPGSIEAMVIDSAGNIIVTGYIVLTNSRTDFCTIKYNPAGERQWVAIYDGIPTSNGINQPASISADQQGTLNVTGFSERTGFNCDDYCTIKYNPNGVQQWVARYNNGASSVNDAVGLVLDKSGNIYITGYSTNTNGYNDFATIKYNTNGDSLWVRRYDIMMEHSQLP